MSRNFSPSFRISNIGVIISKKKIHPIEMLTDYNNFKYFMDKPNFNGRQTRWAKKLFIFDFMISHKSNKPNAADASS